METNELAIGTSLQSGKYTIERILSIGSFGITYYAYHNGLGLHFAIKELFISSCCKRDSSNNKIIPHGIDPLIYDKHKIKFIGDAQILAQINHPNIAKIVDIFQENNTVYIVTPFIEGETLQELVDKNGKLSFEIAINYMKHTLEAIEYIHQRNIFHSDIKPKNIIITPENKAILVDFISARDFIYDQKQQHEPIYIQSYTALEQYSSKDNKSSRSDIYSLAATFYFILTGKKPMDAVTRTMETISEPKASASDIPDIINRAIMKAMSIKPEERQQSISELTEDIFNDKNRRGLIDSTAKQNKHPNWGGILSIYMVLFAISIVVFLHISNNYIDKKVSSLGSMAHENLWEFFKSLNEFEASDFGRPIPLEIHLIIDRNKFNRNVKFTETELPINWGKKYSDIYKYFKIDQNNCGWDLFVAQRFSSNEFITYYLYPGYVGYRKQDDEYMYEFMPSVEDITDNALASLIENQKSAFFDCYEKGSAQRVENFINDFENEYYYLEAKKYNDEFMLACSSVADSYSLSNQYSRLYLDYKNITFYSIKQKDSDIIEKDRKELKIKGLILISCLFIGLLGIHFYIIKKYT